MLKLKKAISAPSLVTGLLFATIAVLLFARAVNSYLSHDEHQFVAPGLALTQQGDLPYVDYPYLHMPLMPMVYGPAMLLGENDFLIARIANEAFLFAALILLFQVILRFSHLRGNLARYLLGWSMVILVVVDPALVVIDGRAMNHALPVLFTVLLILVYMQTQHEEQFPKHAMLMGVLAALATSTRLNFAVTFAPLALVLLFDPLLKSRAIRLRNLWMAFAGTLVGFSPVISLFVAAPGKFYYGNFTHIRLNTFFFRTVGGHYPMDLGQKVAYFFRSSEVFSYDSVIVITALLLSGLVLLLTVLRGAKRIWFQVLVIQAIAAALFASAFAPTPLFPQYFFAPMPFGLLGVFLALGNLPRNREVVVAACLIALLLLVGLRQPAPWEEVDQRFQLLAHPEVWTTTQMRNLSKFVGEHACAEKCLVLTLGPIPVMMANMDVYPWTYVGPFSWRTAPMLSPERRLQYDLVSPADLNEYLLANPPDMILTGGQAHFEGFLPSDPGGIERPFEQFAIEHGFSPLPVPVAHSALGPPLTLWVR